MAKIIVLGSDGRREYELGAAVTTIGRHPDNVVQILDRIVSKEHAQIIRQPTGRYLLQDLGSLNGSFLRGERVGEHLLRRRRRDHAGQHPAACSTSRRRRRRRCSG